MRIAIRRRRGVVLGVDARGEPRDAQVSLEMSKPHKFVSFDIKPGCEIGDQAFESR